MNKRGTVLQRLLLVHADQLRRLDIIGRRVENMSRAVDRVPDDILLHIFTMARFECDVVPELLVSVCHRWLAVVHGPLGALLWSDIDIRMTPGVDAVALVKKTLRHLERSRKYPISVHLGPTEAVPERGTRGLLHTITRPSLHRCTDLNVASFETFRSWFPLDGPLSLKSLHISGEAWGSEEVSPCTLLRAQCLSLSKLKLCMRGPAASDITSILANVSTFTSITHLHIEAQATVEVREALASFHSLQNLRWRHLVSYTEEVQDAEGEETEAVALSLPKLRQLTLDGNAVFRALSGLSAPMLQTLLLLEYATEDPAHWALLIPVQFPNLQNLQCATEDQDMYRIVGSIEGHPKLRNVCWEIRTRFMPDSICALSSFLGQETLGAQSSLPFLHHVDRFSIMPTTPLPSSSTSNELYSDIADQLAIFAVLWNALPAERRPNFKLCMDASLVEASKKIAGVVEMYPDIFLPRVDFDFE